jgi:hypothetical protein
MTRWIVIAGAVVSMVSAVARPTVPHSHPWGDLALEVVPALLVAVAAVVACVAMFRRGVGPPRLVAGLVDGERALVAPCNREWWTVVAALPWLILGMALHRLLPTADADGPLDAVFPVVSVLTVGITVLTIMLSFVGRPTLALGAEGVTHTSRMGGWLVPWAALGEPAAERPAEPGAHNAVLTLRVAGPDLIRVRRFGRPRPAPAQVRLELRQFDVDPSFLADAIDHYAADPAARETIGSRPTPPGQG